MGLDRDRLRTVLAWRSGGRAEGEREGDNEGNTDDGGGGTIRSASSVNWVFSVFVEVLGREMLS